MSEWLAHYGTKRHSGRYPWGSGDDPYQHELGFIGEYQDMKKQGMSEVEIAKSMKMTTTQLRARYSVAMDTVRKAQYSKVMELKEKGLGPTAIGRELDIPESTVRSMLKSNTAVKTTETTRAAQTLKDALDNSKYIDVGRGVESNLGISETKLHTALQKLKDEGYVVTTIPVDQFGTGNKTNVKILAKRPKGMENAPYEEAQKAVFIDASRHKEDIGLVNGDPKKNADPDRGAYGLKPIQNVDAKRVYIRYADNPDRSGKNQDGVIELRRGVKDLDLGKSDYAQVRIGVNGTHYLKGMAMYADDIPDGYDIVFNTNKNHDVPMLGPKDNSVLKPMKSDPDNPFGAVIKPDGQRGALNIVNEEGDWGKWSKTLSSQFLSKQTPELAKKQLGLAARQKADELNDIESIANPSIKRKLLESFADGCDSDAVHLKAAGLPRQASHVILPINTLKDNEIYAPNYHNGEEVVLVRYPHGSISEIPRLVVNNKNKLANSVMHNAVDAVGISPKVAERLSGADFDGDTVTVIPTRGQKINNMPQMKELVGFDPSSAYPKYPGMPEVGKPKSKGGDGFRKGLEMGKVSNLITDMTIKGAPADDIAKALKHSMVIIDAEKHQLNWKQSEIDNDIKHLKKVYQNGGGASTLISRATSDDRVPRRQQYYLSKETIDSEGNKIFKPAKNSTWTDKEGKTHQFTDISTKMYEELMNKSHDARTLSSGTVMENVYADYANTLHSMANKARKEAVILSPMKRSKSAAETYAPEVKSVMSKVGLIVRAKPLERQAIILANTQYRQRVRDNPNLEKDEKKKIRTQLLNEARRRVGSTSKRERNLDLTDREWEAINAGAFSGKQLKDITDNIDEDVLKKRAIPRATNALSSSKISLIKTMESSGYTTAEIADRLGVSTTTVNKYANEE